MKVRQIFLLLVASIALYTAFSLRQILYRPSLDERITSISPYSFEVVNPDLLVYPFKRAYEKIMLNLLSPEEKLIYECKLLGIRFRELLYIFSTAKTSFLPTTSQRYADSVANYKKTYPTSNCSVITNDQNYEVLKILRDNNPANSPYWLIFQQTIDATKN